MKINISFDSSTAAAPSGFTAAIDYVANLYDTLFTNAVTFTVDVGWGEIAGSTIEAGALGESSTSYETGYSYTAIRNALMNNAQSSAQTAADATLPATNPATGQTFYLSNANAEALGLMASGGTVGAIGFDSTQSYDLTPGTTPAAGSYDLIGVAEHELSEVMGRTSLNAGPDAMDLFRYSAPGTRDLTMTPPAPYTSAYFSIDSGTTDLDNWNPVAANGDLGDWAPSAGPDAYDNETSAGTPDFLTTTDTTLMNVIGWTPSTPANTVPAGVTALSSRVGSGSTQTIASGGSAVSDLVFGTQTVSSGGATTGTTISSGGSETVLSGGTASATTIAGGGLLELTDTAGAGSGAVIFSGTGGMLRLDGTIMPGNVVSGFAAGDTIDLHGVTYSTGATVTPGANEITIHDGGVAYTLDIAGVTATTPFALSRGSANEVQATQIACFLAGTRIMTPAGEVAIEQLRIGDLVRTSSGADRPVRWVGRRAYAARFAAANPDLQPVLIRAGALADGVPARDLAVSPRHAMLLDGVLVPAELLVNGVSILRRQDPSDLSYFHIELDSHDLLLAEGAASESFIDCDSRMMFQNAADYFDRYPDAPSPGWAFCAPRAAAGADLSALHRKLAARSNLAEGRVDRLDHTEISGWAFDPAAPHVRLLLEIFIGDRRVGKTVADLPRPDLAAAGKGDGHCAYRFAFTPELCPGGEHLVQIRRAPLPIALLDIRQPLAAGWHGSDAV